MVAPLNTLAVKTVATTLTTDSAGNVVESVPVYLSAVPVANSAGVIVPPTQMVESVTGMPIRIVADLYATNSAGKRVDAMVGRVYQAESLALFQRFTTPPTAARGALIDTLIASLKTAGVWAKLDALYLLAAADAQSSLLNWVQNAYNLTAVNSPAFVADRGYTGDGATSYLNTGFNPITAPSPKFGQNSGAIMLWSRTSNANGGGDSFDMGAGNNYIARSFSIAHRAIGRPLAASGQAFGLNAYPGFTGFSRTAAAVWEGYVNGVDSGGGTTASAAPTNDNIRILSFGSGGFGTNQISVGLISSGLSAAEVLASYNALLALLQAVGAA